MEKRVTIELLVEAEDPDDRVEDDVIAALSECLRHFDIMNYTEESKPAPARRPGRGEVRQKVERF